MDDLDRIPAGRAELLDRTHRSLATTMATIAARSDGRVETDGPMLLYAVPVADPVLWSGAIRVDPGMPAAVFLEAVAAFRSEIGHSLTIWTRDQFDGDLESALRAGPYEDLGTSPEMVFDPGRRAAWRAAPAGIETELVSDGEAVRRFRVTAAAAFEELGAWPASWDAAYQDPSSLIGDDVFGVLVHSTSGVGAVGVGYLHEGVGELVHIGTHPAHRGRGLGTAATVAVADELARRGADVLSLQATPMGEPIYRRLGFVEIGRYRWWLAP
jgi:ribosomal protein S18 acetylase RimI-like enzyme